MTWTIRFLPKAMKDFLILDGSQKKQVRNALDKVSQNPLPSSEGGYGKPLGHHASSNLSSLLKIKLKKAGLRIVYKLERVDTEMHIVVIGVRDEEYVYQLAEKRLKDL